MSNIYNILHEFSRFRNLQVNHGQENLMQFSCPICGDSKTNPNKARGNVYVNKNGVIYKCFNCGAAMGIRAFIAEYIGQEALLQYDCGDLFSHKKTVPPPVPPKPVFNSSFEESPVRPYLIPITKIDHALEYIQKRKIPKSRWKDFYWVESSRHLALIDQEKYQEKAEKWPKDERIVVPLFDSKMQFTGLQGRALNPEAKIRYMTLSKRGTNEILYGWDRVKIGSAPILVTEGAFDATFIFNGVSVQGSSLFQKASEAKMPKNNTILVFDNEPLNKDIYRLAKKAVDNEWIVAIWPNSIREKDINQMVLKGELPDNPREVSKIISSFACYGFEAKIKMLHWRERF